MNKEWEPEPLRWLGVNVGIVGLAIADVEESITHRPSIVHAIVEPLIER